MSKEPETFIKSLLPKNFICELMLDHEVVMLITISRRTHTLEEAKDIFRKEAKRLKEEEEVASISLRIHS